MHENSKKMFQKCLLMYDACILMCEMLQREFVTSLVRDVGQFMRPIW